MNYEKLRPGQLGSLDVIFERLQAGETHTAIVLATRYGKSDLIRLAAYLGNQRRLIGGAIAFSPAENLSEQLIRPQNIKAMADRYGLDLGQLLKRIRRLRTFGEIRPFSNGEYLLAANTQLALQTKAADFCELIDSERERTGLPIAIFIDECQVVSEQKKWGEFFNAATNVGGLLVLMTATAIRDDGACIPGFEYETLGKEESMRWFATDAGDGVHNRIEKWRGCERVIKLKPHYEVTFKDAWSEDPSPLCQISRTVIDLEVNPHDPERKTRLRDMSVSEAMRALGKAVRDPVLMEHGVRKMLEHLRDLQAVDRTCAAIVFTASDRGPSRGLDEHARAIRELCRRLGQGYLGHTPEVTIVTMNTLEDEKASEQLRPFIGDDQAPGRGDILVVKQIGGAGLDCARLKVGLDLSTTRTVAATVQRLMRPATPMGGNKIAHIVTPDDPLMNALFKKFIADAGGELTEAKIWEAENLEGSYLKPKPPEPEDPGLRFGDSELAGYDDSHGNVGLMTVYERVMELRRRIPPLAGMYTDVQLCEALKDCSFIRDEGTQPYEERTHKTLDTSLEVLKQNINEAADKCATKRTNQQCGGYDAAVWAAERRQVFTTAYRAAGVPRGVTLSAVTNLDTLTRILGILEQESERLF